MLKDKGNNINLIDFEGRDWLINKYNSLLVDEKLTIQQLAREIQSADETTVFCSDGNVVMPNFIE